MSHRKMSWRKLRFAELLSAVIFLTCLPVPVRWTAYSLPGQGRAVWAYPLIGGLVGCGIAGVYMAGVAAGLPLHLSAVLAILASVFFTGALHEDGLADTADGFGGGMNVKRKLEIMRDSQIGSYGTLALIFSVLLRAGALAALPLGMAGPVVVAASVLSRTSMVVPFWVLPLARSDGLAVNAGRPEPLLALVAVVIGLTLFFALLPIGAAVVTGVLVAASVAGITWLARAQIGGVTGDVLGATEQIAQIIILLCLAALLRPE